MGGAIQIFALVLRGFVWLFFTVIQGFLSYIDVVDALLTTGFCWLMLHKGAGWDSWWALALGLLVSLILYIILKHRIGFWFVAAAFSAIWTALFGVILDGFFPTMPEILFWVVCIAAFAWNVFLHSVAKDRAALQASIEEDNKRMAQMKE